MLESFLFNAEQKGSFFKVLFASFIITVVLGFLNQFIGSNSLFLVALVSLALSYPVVNYIRSMNKDEIEHQLNCTLLFMRHEKEMKVFWALFLGVVIGFYLVSHFGFTTDFSYQQKFVEGVSGKFLDGSNSFKVIFINNLIVVFFTFIISAFVFSGLIFILVWNASIISYYFYSLSGEVFLRVVAILPHGLLEVGGYVFAGIAGSILAYKFDRGNRFEHELDSEFAKDLAVLLFGAFFLILLGAMVETI